MKLHRLGFFLLILLLPVQLGYHFWPDWAMVLGRRVDYLSPTVYLTDFVVLFTITSWLAAGLPGFKKQILRAGTFKLKRIGPIFLFGLFVAVNIFLAANRPEAVYKWSKILEFFLLGLYVVKTKPKFSAIVFPLSVAVLYSSLLAVFQFLLQHSLGGWLWWLGERSFTADTPGIARVAWCWAGAARGCRELLRPYATFPHPNVLGGFLATALPFVMIKLADKPNVKSAKFFYLISLVMGITALGLTFSRSAWLAGVVAVASAAVVVGHYQFKIWNKTTIIFSALCIFTFLLSVGLIKVNPGEESVVVRNQLNAAAVTIFRQSPFLGVGLGNFLVELPKVLPYRTVYFLQPAHNIYLLFLAETGIAGLAIFLWIVGKALPFFRAKVRHLIPREKKITGIYCLSLTVLLLLGLIDHYAVTLQQGQLLLTLLLGLSLTATNS